METKELYKNEEWLRGKYWDEELSTGQIGKICNCDKSQIQYWLQKYDILIRSQSEAACVYHKRI